MEIHPTAIVSPKAELGENVKVLPYSIIGSQVTIGSGSVIGPHAIVDGRTTLGRNNQVFPFATVGYPPQDISYKGEDTECVIGDGNIIRESVTIHRGTAKGGGITRIGNGCCVMAYVHVAHDCNIGNHVILSSGIGMAGHVEIHDHAIVGGMVAIHQFVRIGSFAFVGGMSGLRMDIPPYMLAHGAPAKLYGPNLVGLRRHKFPMQTVQALKRAYKILFRSTLTVKDAVDKIREEIEPLPEIEKLLQFMQEDSRRGVTRWGSDEAVE
ncbi:MAG TPA: acyl-ACP--UDP-N-acetylglucosamine O-acyltransferase [Syntrophobacteraceae bacterium]|nr:acyl-ACP--UDP-N-acetylglucosamine O-acyltransferase [Syntrophobacteraceae bacterium]